MKPDKVMKQAHQRRKVAMYEPVKIAKDISIEARLKLKSYADRAVLLATLNEILDKYARGKKEIIMEELERRLK